MQVIRRARYLRLAILSLLFLCCSGNDDPTTPDGEPSPFPAPSSPESLLVALKGIYNDSLHSVEARTSWYEDLLSPDHHAALPAFTFHLASMDTQLVTWGLSDDVAATQSIFANYHEISLDFEWEILAPAFPDNGWRAAYLTNVLLELTTTWSDSLRATGTTTIVAAPADDRWYIVNWYDSIRPSPFLSWGQLKASQLQ